MMIQQIVIKTLVTGIVAFTGALAVSALFYLAVPSSDPFWQEGVGISILGIAAVIVSLLTQRVLGDVVLANVGGDIAGLLLAILGLAFQLGAGPSATHDQQVMNNAMGLFLAGSGFAMTMLISDFNDKNPLNPFRWVEEIFSGIAAAYSVAAFGELFT